MGAGIGNCCSQRDEKDAPVPVTAPPGGFSAASNNKPVGYVVNNPGRIGDFYEMSERMGEGSYGSVKKAIKKDTKSLRAIKTIEKSKLQCNSARKQSRARGANKDKADEKLKLFRREVDIMSTLDHPHIIRLYETFEDARHYHLVMEVCHGGELFDHIVEAGNGFSEVQAAHVMEQIIKGVNYMHHTHIAHRDLKPENFLCLSKDAIDKNTIKIIDFGLSCSFKRDRPMQTRAGTPYYVAPEVIKGKYDELCDMWSSGAIMYVLLCGMPPFNGDTDTCIMNKVSKGRYSYSDPIWQTISQDARDLIDNLLVKDKQRFSAEKALEHRWIAEKAPKAKGVLKQTTLVSNLKQFQAANKFKKAALQIIANQLDDTNGNTLRAVFSELDKNGDGLLTLAEIRTGLEKAGLTETLQGLEETLSSIDADGSGVIDYTEFLSAALDREQYEKEDILWSAFRVFDRDNDGKITKDELLAVLNRNADDDDDTNRDKTLVEIFEDVDKDGDGEIDFEEFKKMMTTGGEIR